MNKVIIGIIVLATGAGAAYFYTAGTTTSAPVVTTVEVSRGSVVHVVQASGALEAVTTVQVGTQVSGIIQSLNADFNSLVRKGQVIATLDPSLFQTQIEQADATLVRLNADLDRLRVQADSARRALDRTTTLAERQLVSAADLDAAAVAVRLAEAQLRSAEAQVVQAQASLNQNRVNLDHTVIRAPIDGIVISRAVDVGQTVAASMSAPTLFVIAQDLTRMQASAAIDESDVGLVRPEQPVTFTVDAYPGETFAGEVSQLRLQPTVVQNVVTYTAMIDVPNPDLKLKPGMTASVVVEVARRDNVLRIPAPALRFKPSADLLAAIGAASAGTDSAANAKDGTRAAGAAPSGTAGIQRAVLTTSARTGASASGTSAAAVVRTAATTQADGMEVYPPDSSRGTVWMSDGGALTPVAVRVGITDGTYVELIAGDLAEGSVLVTKASLSGAATTAPTGRVSSPLLPSGPSGPPPGGPPPR